MNQQAVRTTKLFRDLIRSTTHKELAKEIGVSRSLITMITHNFRTPSLGVALRIAKRFNKNVEELFTLEQTGSEGAKQCKKCKNG